MLSDTAVRDLANGKGATFIFDFSEIDARFYESLLRTLQRFIPKNVEQLGFTCDNILDARRRASSGSQIPDSVTRSIAKNRKHYVNNIVELLCHVIPRSSRLKSLKLSNVDFLPEQILRIAESISKSVSIEALSLNRISIGDDGLQIILKKLDSNQLRSLSILFCDITKVSTPYLLAFAKSRTASGTGIAKIDLSAQEIPQSDIIKIHQALKISGSPSPKKRLGSPQIDANKKNYALNTSGSPSPQKRQESPQFNSFSKTTNQGKFESLQKENIELKAELARLRGSVHSIQYNEKVYVIGRGAEQFVHFLKEIETKLHTLEEQRSKMKSFV